MQIVKIAVIDENEINMLFFRELFSRWNVELNVIHDVENSLIRLNIIKPKLLLVSTDLNIDYLKTLTFIVNRNYPIILYGEAKPSETITKLPRILGYIDNKFNVSLYSKLISKVVGSEFFVETKNQHIELVINDKIAVLEIGGHISWEKMHELKYKLIELFKNDVIGGLLIIFHEFENIESVKDSILHFFGFLEYTKIDPYVVKYLSMNKNIDEIIKEDELLKKIEKAESYADAFTKLQSLILDKSKLGMDIDFLRPESKLLEDVYDEYGNLIKKAGEVFSKDDIKNIKSRGISRIYHARDLSALGVSLNNIQSIKNSIEDVIIKQVEYSNDSENKKVEMHMGVSNKLVLIVEDDPGVQKLLSVVFDKIKIKYKIASNGDDGLKMAISYNSDLILLDLMLPGLNGVQFIKKYNEIRKKGRASIVVISGVNRPDVIKTLLQMGVKDYLLKPLDINVLMSRISKIFNVNG